MKLHTATVIITTAFMTSLGGFILSAAMPQSKVSDALMTVALFGAAASGILASLFTKKLVKSKQWKYFVAGILLFMTGFFIKITGFRAAGEIFNISGAVIAIAALGLYIYQHRTDFKHSKWVWFIPFILLGCLFKLLYWPGGNMIILASLLTIMVLSVIQLAKPGQNTKVQVLLLAWQIAMCVCIAAFYFGHIHIDPFFIGYIFILLALVDIFLHQEKA